MKKLICFILGGFLFFSSYGQAIINRAGAANTVQDARLMAQYNLFVPRYADTTSALSGTNEGIDSCGAIIFTYDIMALWFRSCYNGGKKWVQILPNGGGSGGTLAWVMGGNNPVVSDGSGYGLIGPQTNNGLSAITNNVVRFSINTSGAFGLGSGRDFGTAGQALLSQGNGSAPIWGTPSSTTPTWQQTLTAGSTLSSSNTIVSGANTQTFTFNTLNGTGFSISSSSTSGVVIPQKLLSSVYTGAHAIGGVSSYAGFFSNQHTGSTSLNVGVWAQAFGGTTNVGLLVDRGSIDIGQTGTETGILNMYGSTSGKITFQSQAAAGTYNWNWPTTAGTSGYFLTSAGGGSSAMTWTNPSSLTGLPYVALVGTSTATGDITLDMNANSLYLTNTSGSGEFLFYDAGVNEGVRLGFSGNVFFKAERSTNKAYIYSNAISGGSAGDALTVVDPSTGEVGVAPNLAFNFMKENTMIYAKNGRLWAEDADKNLTQISPHNDKGEWIYKSVSKDGVTTEINMIKLAELLEKVTGEKLIYKTKN